MRVLINSHTESRIFMKLFAQFYREYDEDEYMLHFSREEQAITSAFGPTKIISLGEYLHEKGFGVRVSRSSHLFMSLSDGWVRPYVISVFNEFDLIRLLAL